MACQILDIEFHSSITNGNFVYDSLIPFNTSTCSVHTFEEIARCYRIVENPSTICCRIVDTTYINVPLLGYNTTEYPYANCTTKIPNDSRKIIINHMLVLGLLSAILIANF